MKLLRKAPGTTAALLLIAGLTAACNSTAIAPTETLAPTSRPVSSPTPPSKSWILVDLPPDATQLEYGSEVWRLVCSTCHAYDGTGLTDAWRATWAPKDQNCWQSKCHGPNHPPDGFELPVAPSVVGDAALAPYPTALELHDYIQATMPWQGPGTLIPKDSWAVTAYVVKLNRLNPGTDLGPSNASQIQLGKPRAAQQPAAAQPAERPSIVEAYWPFVGAIAIFLIVGLVVAWRFSRRRRISG